MSWDSFQNLLPKVAGKYNFRKTFKAIEICQEYRSLAPKLLKADALENTFPVSYENQTLTIGVLNSGWAQQIQMHGHRIQQAINQKYGEKTVQKLRIEVSEKMPAESLLDNKN